MAARMDDVLCFVLVYGRHDKTLCMRGLALIVVVNVAYLNTLLEKWTWKLCRLYA